MSCVLACQDSTIKEINEKSDGLCFYAAAGCGSTRRVAAQWNVHRQQVLQRNQKVPVWGTADPSAKVTVEFAGQKKVGVADADGKWLIHLKSMKASSNPQKMPVTSSIGNQQSSIGNVLVGDVWLCAGQSNMATLMRHYPLVWDTVKEGFFNDQIRFFKIKQGGVGSPEPTKELVIDPFFKNSWQACSPEFSEQFSATAGFFGMKLQKDTGVPVGLLYANRGGTQANM